MVRTSQSLRVLGPGDVAAALELIDTDPVVNVFADYRTRITQLDPRWLGGEMWGYFEATGSSRCATSAPTWSPSTPRPRPARRSWTVRYGRARAARRSSAPTTPWRSLWEGLEEHWPTPRDFRWDQPHLVTRCSPTVPRDPLVRRTTKDEVEALYPACVAMYTEEVGISPELDGGRDLYRARVNQLVGRGWSFSRIEDGRVLFKAEVACATPSACQIQGVYVDPELRGQGLCTAGMATVVDTCLREIAPAVSLYVNAHNLPARAAYRRAGFEQTGTFATIMF